MELPLTVVAERVREEIEARELRGFAVGDALARWERARPDRAALMALHADLAALPRREEWPYAEPSDLDGIRGARPAAVALPVFAMPPAELLDKIHGGWLGRAAGCVLGKPFEMHLSMEEIRCYLQGAGALPLADYVPAHSRDDRVLRRDSLPSMRGYVRYAQEDDDLNYMCLAVKLLERIGPGFTTLDVGMNWLGSIPFLWTWGPEHVVYLNLAAAVGEHVPGEVDLDAVAAFLNPGVEWVGAQIRTDVYGYVCPGDPERAADFAWRDAVLSHRESGIYGAIWIAAMNAAAFFLHDAQAVIEAGLAQVPANSRFAEAVRATITWWRADGDWRATGERIAERYGAYGFAGTIPNACCVAAALLEGWGDGTGSAAEIYERAITVAVQLGFDTDCNGASVGSLVGVMLGGHALPAKWTDPLHDTLRTCVAEFGQVGIAEMARRTFSLSREVRQATSPDRT
jgi:ADP-ribosylglycohydrolase